MWGEAKNPRYPKGTTEAGNPHSHAYSARPVAAQSCPFRDRSAEM